MNSDQTAPREQSYLCPLCLKYWLHVPKRRAGDKFRDWCVKVE